MGLPMFANADGDSMAFIGNTKIRQHVAKMLNLQGQPLGFDTIFEGAPQYWTNLIPSNLTKGTGTNLSALIYVNWSDLLIGFWSELDASQPVRGRSLPEGQRLGSGNPARRPRARP